MCNTVEGFPNVKVQDTRQIINLINSKPVEIEYVGEIFAYDDAYLVYLDKKKRIVYLDDRKSEDVNDGEPFNLLWAELQSIQALPRHNISDNVETSFLSMLGSAVSCGLD